MPPRIQTTRLSQSASCRGLYKQTTSESRAFHASVPRTLAARRSRSPSTEKGPDELKAIKHRPLSKANSRTLQRRRMLQWLTGPGQNFRDPLPGSSNYLSAYDRFGKLARLEGSRQEESAQHGDGQSLPKERFADLRPYPQNHAFRSQPVLSEELREQIYQMVVTEEQNVEDVAASYQIDLRRVAAVVRLKTVEKQWLQSNKKLVTPYARAVMAMLPQTPYHNRGSIVPHESINDLPVHPKTRQQMFYPASESRQFNREDAAKAFSDTLLPADQRVPLPQLIKSEKMILEGKTRDERIRVLREDNEREAAAKAKKEEKKKAWERETQRFVPTSRWVFKFQDIGAQRISPQGRSQTAVGARYGWPHEDRKRGMRKIPTSVE